MTRKYLLSNLVLAATLWMLASTPLYCQWIWRMTGIDFLALLNNQCGIGEGKSTLVSWISCAFVAISAALLIRGFNQPARWRRLLVFVLCVPIFIAPSLWMERGRDDSISRDISRISIDTPRKIDFSGMFGKKGYLNRPIASFDDFFLAVTDHWERNRSEYEEIGAMGGAETLKASFFMNVVSNLWSLGDSSSPSVAGCVRQNRNTGTAGIPDENVSIGLYLRSEIGCCTDYSQMMSYLLQRSGIRSRFVSIPGHVFNEAFVDGAWKTFDPTINVLYHAQWSRIAEDSDLTSVRITVFPLRSSEPDSGDYRAEAGRLRIQMIVLASRAYKLVSGACSYMEDDLPAFFGTPRKAGGQPPSPSAPKGI